MTYTTFTPPVLSQVGPLFVYDGSMSPQSRALMAHMRPLDQPVNVYVLSNDAVVTDYAAPITATSENGEATTSSVGVPYPWFPNETGEGPPEGAEGGPYNKPQPYATVTNWDLSVQTYTTDPYIRYWFRGGLVYPHISQHLVGILLNAGYVDYLS